MTGGVINMKYTKKELKNWWIAKCPRCGWEGLSRDCAGGGQIADIGDSEDSLCPECFKEEIWVIVDDIDDL